MQKSKLLALFLAVAMVVSMIVVPAYAADATHCDKCGEVTWTPWTGDAATIKAGGHFKLTADVTVSEKITLGENVCLDLAGSKITTTGRSTTIFQVGSTVSLSIMDSVGGGKITYTGTNQRRATLILLYGTLNLHSGAIDLANKMNYAGANGGCVNMERSTSVINLYGGEIKGGDARANSTGGNVYATNGTINIYGGAISGGNTYNNPGGNIYATGATINLYGGSVTGGTTDGTGTGNGKDIYAGEGSVVNVYAGQTDNVYVDGGTVKIYNGTVGFENEVSNVVAGCACYTKTENTYTVWNYGHDGDDTNGTCDCSAFETAKAEIPANLLLTGEHDMVEGTCSICGFTAATEEPPVEEPVLTYCEYCKDDVEWNEWTAETDLTEVAAGGHWKVMDETITTDPVAPAAMLCVDLNGNSLISINTAKKNVFAVTAATLNIMDSSEDETGTVLGRSTNLKTNNGGVISLKGADAVLNLYSGTITAGCVKTSEDVDGGNISVERGATFNMHGGAVTDGRAYRGGNIYIAGGTVNLKGGTVSGGTATSKGGNIYMTTSSSVVSTLNIKSGVIIGAGSIERGNKSQICTIEAGVSFVELPTVLLTQGVVGYDGEKYMTFATYDEAVAYAAGETGTITLGANLTVENMSLNNVAKLNINGKQLTVTGIFNGENSNVVDESSDKSGTIVCKKATFAPNNQHLPITVDAEAGVIVLESGRATVAESQNNATSEIKKFGFYFDALKDNTKLDEAIANGTVNIMVKLLVNDEEVYTGVMADKAGSVLEAYVADWDAGAILLKITGVEVDDLVEVQIFVESNGALINYSASTAE